jgi:hypothetical protein
MNCGICIAHLREKNKCPGCRGDDTHKPITRSQCMIKTCCAETGSKFCYDCSAYPCGALKHLDERYRKNYGMSMIANLEDLRRFGIKKFLKNEKAKWACPKCGGTICVHKGYCLECGK